MKSLSNSHSACSGVAGTDGYRPRQPEQTVGCGGNDTLSGGNDDDIIFGQAGVDTITGDAGDDLIAGGTGNDVMDGGSGIDTLYYAGATTGGINVDLSTNTVSNDGDAGADIIDNFENVTGSGFADTITGSDANNVIDGGASGDLLYGGAGDDTLYGGDGLDTYYGGVGADTVVLETATAFNNIDQLMDFNTAEGDALNLADILTAYDEGTMQLEDFLQFATSGANTTVSVDVNGTTGGTSWTQIAVITGVTGITDEDALVASGSLVVS